MRDKIVQGHFILTVITGSAMEIQTDHVIGVDLQGAVVERTLRKMDVMER